jgi:glycine/D-amino acid oxidase-like deaminating enzyme
MTRKRVVIIGAGLSGSVLAARLRNQFNVTVVEQSRTKRPLYDEIRCAAGGVNNSINRAAGLGGTTNYWHNALIELTDEELHACGVDRPAFAPYYERAWSLFLSPDELATSAGIRDENAQALRDKRSAAAHMVVPHARVNMWEHADRAYPGEPVHVVFGHAERLVLDDAGVPAHLIVNTSNGPVQVVADHFIFCAGGLGTPSVLAASLGLDDVMCGGYHDHPMAYVAKIRLTADSILKRISCQDTGSASVRTGFV